LAICSVGALYLQTSKDLAAPDQKFVFRHTGEQQGVEMQLSEITIQMQKINSNLSKINRDAMINAETLAELRLQDQ